MIPTPVRRLAALAALTSLSLGCLSVHPTTRRAVGGETGGIAVRIYLDDHARKAGQIAPPQIASVVEERHERTWRPVFRSLSSSWTLAGLAPGKYRLRFPSRLDDGGVPQPLSQGARTIEVRRGVISEVETTLEHVSPGLVAAGVVTAILAAVVLSDFLDANDLPLPPPPPPDLVEAIVWVTLDAVLSPETWHGHGSAPAVTSHFPAEGDLVAAPRVRVTFSLSEPLAASAIDADAVTVVAEGAGEIPGTVRYDAERWWIVWEPESDLPRNETFHVTLHPDAVADESGNALPTTTEFSFRTAR